MKTATLPACRTPPPPICLPAYLISEALSLPSSLEGLWFWENKVRGEEARSLHLSPEWFPH